MQIKTATIVASLALLVGCGGGSGEASTAKEALPGENTYKSTCSICHRSGLNSAPRIDNKKDWDMRLLQGNEALYDHAINGYHGSRGYMPPRGSNTKLSDDEVRTAVNYMVMQATRSGH